MKKYTIRHAKIEDKERILEIYAYARKFMEQNGNPNQWKNNNPSEEVIDNDIKNHELYVIEESSSSDACITEENGEVRKSEYVNNNEDCKDRLHGVFFFKIGEDATYTVIEDGRWLSDEKYGTIHRVASDGGMNGVLNMVVQFCEQKIGHLRIDTHNDNRIMQHVIEKNGFTRCGIIYVEDGSPRIAYEKIGK